VWSVDGTAYQTNFLQAGSPTNGAYFTAAFAVGPHQVTASVSDPSQCTAACLTAVSVETAPTIACPVPITLNCAPPTGAAATVSVNVTDTNGGLLTVVWTVNGTPRQTNMVAGGSPPTSAGIDFTALFPVGANRVMASVSAPSGCSAGCSTTVTVIPKADLYPIALSYLNVAGATNGTILPDIYNGVQPGNFGWLTWAGSPSEPTLAASLTSPGNSSTYSNPFDLTDHRVSIGDWVQGKPGAPNSEAVRDKLDALEAIDTAVPIWDQAISQGDNCLYRVVAFARVRIISHQSLPVNRITARFLGFTSCQ
jgi:hypothetical protein